MADALDMTSGRTRISFEAGSVNIHTLSAAAIEKIDICPGENKPVRIAITMSNSAGLFQIDELLKKKPSGSGIVEYMDVVVTQEADQEKKLLGKFEF